MSAAEISKLQEIYEMGFIGESEYHERMARLVGPSYVAPPSTTSNDSIDNSLTSTYLSSSSSGSLDFSSVSIDLSTYEPPLPTSEPPPLHTQWGNAAHYDEPPLPDTAPPPLNDDSSSDRLWPRAVEITGSDTPHLPPAPPPALHAVTSIMQSHPNSVSLIQSLVRRYNDTKSTSEQCPQCLSDSLLVDQDWGLCELCVEGMVRHIENMETPIQRHQLNRSVLSNPPRRHNDWVPPPQKPEELIEQRSRLRSVVPHDRELPEWMQQESRYMVPSFVSESKHGRRDIREYEALEPRQQLTCLLDNEIVNILEVDTHPRTIVLDRFLKAIEKTAPSEICNLRNSALYVFPRELLTRGVANNLVLLTISNNYLTELPQNIDQLRVLEQLTVDHNRLSALPASLAKITSLVAVEASYNRIQSLPQPLNALVSRGILNVSNNPMTINPCSLAQAFVCGRYFMSQSHSVLPAPRQTKYSSRPEMGILPTGSFRFSPMGDNEGYSSGYNYYASGRPPKRIVSSAGRAFEAHIKTLPVLSAEDRVRLSRWSYLV